MKPLNQLLEEYGRKDYYAFHMPGHKRQMEEGAFCNPFSADITEIEGFDDLHHPRGILKEAQQRAAKLYGARSSYYLVNGSTAGILSTISACTTYGGTLLMARNCHKAVYHAAYLRGLQTAYVYPKEESEYGICGGILPEDVREALIKSPQTEAVIITSPTYEGVVSDVRSIATVVHEHGIPLLVDEAHGAHLGFHPYFPESALTRDADLVIQSLHKTMPSLTQTALLHQNSDRISVQRLERFLDIYQTSSPSYVLMGSMDNCICKMLESGRDLFESYASSLQECREQLSYLCHLQLLPRKIQGQNGIYGLDPSKLVITTGNYDLTGRELYFMLLDRYHLQMEMSTENYVLAMTSVMDRKEGYLRLCRALAEIDSTMTERKGDAARDRSGTGILPRSEQVLSVCQALDGKTERIPIEKSEERIAGEYLYLYPPGIPLLVPGERITAEVLEKIIKYQEQGLNLQGSDDDELKTIGVSCNI